MSSPLPKVTKDIVILDRGKYTTCTVHLHGGTILSYRIENREILYMKKKTTFDKFSAIRGGIKFAFPYFGNRISGPKHGFTRFVPWSLDEGPTMKPDGNVEAVFSLRDTEYTRTVWCYRFKISYRLTLCMNSLRIDMKVENTCKYFPFYFNVIRYTILKAKDVRKCEIYGLSTCKQISLLDTSSKLQLINPNPDSEKITIQREYLDLFLDAPDTVEVRNIDNHGQTIRLTSTNSTGKDVVIYNPWEQNSEDLAEAESHYENEYLHFVGIGQGHLYSDIRLEPKQIWKSYHLIEVVNEEYERSIEALGILLDDPLKLFKETCLKTEVYFDSNK